MEQKSYSQLLLKLLRSLFIRLIRIPLYWLVTVPYLIIAVLLFGEKEGFLDSAFSFVSVIAGKGREGDLEFSDVVLVTALVFFGLGVLVDMIFQAVGSNKSYEFMYNVKKIILIVGYAVLGVVFTIESDDIIGAMIFCGSFLVASLILLLAEKIFFKAYGGTISSVKKRNQ